ncbi:DUF1684 domain-containing protein [Arthrobacter ruber]|uniref:DUF1684 domain-containing protein n=1 Tax=Arthrobacter ruber TaxID=1258893 RepID=UPI000CF50EA5|nr:DUF1684 domain-containing protein [Arthrobacter ruber]
MSPTQTAEERWIRFRAARDAALAEPHGWLSLTSYHWLPDQPAALDSVPGRWSSEGGTARVIAQPSDGLTALASGELLEGTLTAVLDDEDSLLWAAYGGADGHRVVVELVRRAGRYAIRTRDAEAPVLARFTGNPVFGYRPDLVVDGRFEPYGQPQEEPISTAHPEVPGTLVAAGDVVFSLPGDSREYRLRASQDEAGALDITFHDATNATSTAPWRKVTARRPRPDGSVVLDFNRTINYPSAFTPFGTCPMPVDSNVVDAPIEAGEKLPLP